MAKKTTLKPIGLGYRPVGSAASVEYTKFMGVLRGLTIAQDEPESTEIEAPYSVVLTPPLLATTQSLTKVLRLPTRQRRSGSSTLAVASVRWSSTRA